MLGSGRVVAMVGDVAVAAARVALKYEEINLVELRVLSGEKVPRQTLDLLS